MKTLISKKSATKIIISGAILVGIGFVGSIINFLSVYGKASKITSCPKTSDCGLSSNLLISHIGIVVLYVGLASVTLGIAALIIANSKHGK